MVAERGPPFVDPAANCTVPPPEPVEPDVIVSHASLLVAVQAQPAPAATSKLALPPDAAMFVEVGEIENAQPLPWFTVKVWPAIVNVPVRELVLVLAATV